MLMPAVLNISAAKRGTDVHGSQLPNNLVQTTTRPRRPVGESSYLNSRVAVISDSPPIACGGLDQLPQASPLGKKLRRGTKVLLHLPLTLEEVVHPKHPESRA